MGKLTKSRFATKMDDAARPSFFSLSPRPRKSTLDEERYLTLSGPIHLTGIQALVRLQFDGLRLLNKIYPDKKFAYFISGYEGSPLGGFDINLRKIYSILKQWKIIHVPGGNEEAGANMMWGSQLHRLFGPSKVDGVIGAWYGKGPGVRRISDVEDHLQMAGIDKFCAAYFISGDDHVSKSSTTPHQTDFVHYANHVPTAYPGNIQEILHVGKRIILASMISGLAINLKVETCVCDGSQEFILNPDEDRELKARFLEFAANHPDYKRHFSPVLLKPRVLINEEELFYSKLPMIQEISREFGFDTWKNRNLHADFGVVTTGKSYYDFLGALKQLDIAENEVEIYKPMITWPPDMKTFREFSKGKKEIIVIEEKQSFYENHIKSELFNDTARPLILGKFDEMGNKLFRQNANFDADFIAAVMGPRLAAKEPFKNRKIEVALKERELLETATRPVNIKRPPAYCSGCQHRTALEISGHNLKEGTVMSTVVRNKDLDGKPVTIEITPKHIMGIGIGCSTMSIIDSLASNRAVVVGPMESEGLLWMGASAFSFRMHADQGCGDGTYFHSARLNISFIRDTIEHLKVHYGIEDTHQTLLYVDNNVVAMTGGQRPVGQDDPETAIATIQQEGIEHIAVVAEHPEEFQHLKKKYGIEVYPKSDTLKVKEEFSQKSGLSVIWYVQKCGIEKVRERRKNQELAPKTRVHVNPEVCENCGDCGLEAKCASVWKTDTWLGPKVRIHQYSCIQDFGCAKGDCPSYVKVYTRSGNPLKKPDFQKLLLDNTMLPSPQRNIDRENPCEIYSIGIGGWGLMTANEILARAATTEGANVVKEDDTGLAQKGGEVRNSLKISFADTDIQEGFNIEVGGADLYISSDLIGAVNPDNLKAASRKKSRAIVNTEKIPTMPMIVGQATYPDSGKMKAMIDEHTRRDKNIYVNATRIVENLFKDFKPTNLFLLGISFQAVEEFPIERAESIEEAIQMNNVDIERNILAFRYGRLYAVDPDRVMQLAFPGESAPKDNLELFRQKLGQKNGILFNQLLKRISCAGPPREKIAREIFELFMFQNGSYAERFVEFVEEIQAFDQSRFSARNLKFTECVADNLFRVMAYKDEYRVADLLTRPEEIQNLTAQYDPGEIRKIRYLLRPPILGRIPWLRNLKFIRAKFENDEKWETPGWLLSLLKHFKFLRGTGLDPFAWGSEIRRMEMGAAEIYKERIRALTHHLHETNYAEACAAAAYPGLETGYDAVKEIHHKKAEEFWAQKSMNVLSASTSLSPEPG